jgi:hypothetical protein
MDSRRAQRITIMNLDIRRQQRFQNFDRAVELLREPLEGGVDKLSMLAKEGIVRRFGVSLELAWKTLKVLSRIARCRNFSRDPAQRHQGGLFSADNRGRTGVDRHA